MKKTLSTSEIINLLLNDEYCKFSYDACIALADYFHSVEEDTGEEIEFDAVAIRCSWAEFKSAEEVAECYSNSFKYQDTSRKSFSEQLEDFLNHNTTFIKVGKGYLVYEF